MYAILEQHSRVPSLLYSGPSLRELSGGNWIILWGSVVAAAPETSGLGTSQYVPLLGNYSALYKGLTSRLWPAGVKIVTWLILPVVICLSQRLSHACLSISNLYCETANGSLNQS